MNFFLYYYIKTNMRGGADGYNSGFENNIDGP